MPLIWREQESNLVAEADPPLANVLVVQVGLRLLDLLLIFQEHDRETSVLAALNLDMHVFFLNVESLEEFDHLWSLRVPGEPANLAGSVAVFIVNDTPKFVVRSLPIKANEMILLR